MHYYQQTEDYNDLKYKMLHIITRLKEQGCIRHIYLRFGLVDTGQTNILNTHPAASSYIRQQSGDAAPHHTALDQSLTSS